jgi:hypothetical protein
MRFWFSLMLAFSSFSDARATSDIDVSGVACEALELGELLVINYHGSFRLLEVHVVGQTKEGIALIRAWQIKGPGDDPEGWRSFHANEISEVLIQDEESKAPRLGYNSSDPAITEIQCRV